MGVNADDDLGSLSFLVRRTWLAMRAEIGAALKEFGLSPPQYATLGLLTKHPGRSNAEIARLVGNTRQAANEMLAALERNGLITRSPHPTDRRAQQLHLTDEGIALLDAAAVAVARREAELEASFTDEERAMARKWLRAIGDSGKDHC
jgi:DNA-binding MarR family transcriptional regulator